MRPNEKVIEVIVRAGARERSVMEDEQGNVTVRTTYPPEKGRANRDVIELLANHFNLPKSCFEIVSGQTYFRKRIKIYSAR